MPVQVRRVIVRPSVRGWKWVGAAALAVGALVGVGGYATAQALPTVIYSKDNPILWNFQERGRVYTSPKTRAGIDDPDSELAAGVTMCQAAFPGTVKAVWVHAEIATDEDGTEMYSITWYCYDPDAQLKS